MITGEQLNIPPANFYSNDDSQIMTGSRNQERQLTRHRSLDKDYMEYDYPGRDKRRQMGFGSDYYDPLDINGNQPYRPHKQLPSPYVFGRTGRQYDSETRLNRTRPHDRERWASAEEVYQYSRSDRSATNTSLKNRSYNQNDYGYRDDRDYYGNRFERSPRRDLRDSYSSRYRNYPSDSYYREPGRRHSDEGYPRGKHIYIEKQLL